MIKVGIVGGSGYAGVELLRLLAQHPEVELTAITSRAEAGTAVAKAFPNLRGRVDLNFSDPAKTDLKACDAVFFATPGGVAMNEAQGLVDAGVRVLDLSADFRLRDVAEWEHWYGMKHACPALIEQAAYGLPEMYRAKIKTARLVAVPGCYPTAVQLGFLPLVEAQVVDTENLIADAKSGVSGAGRKTEVALLHGEVAENFKAYNVPGHRHLPEIRQGLAQVLGRSVGLTFVAHLLPIVRGIHATLYARLTRETDLQALYEERYRNEPFVDVLPPGTHPETRWVRASNMCRIALHKPQGRDTVVVLAVIDNLVKGAAGQAVQNLNLMFGFEETLGLTQIAVVP
jgi:N-acetyl-gamma-glutamyl-phosphate reductase